MPAKVLTTEFGHSMPPEGPHTVTFHVPGWTTILGIRDGDQALFARLTSMYPRFAPWGLCRQLGMAIGKKLGLPPDNAVQFWLAPDALEMAKAYGTSEYRKQVRLAESDLTFKAIEIGGGGIRLFAVAYHMSKSPAMGGAWQNPGLSASTRLAEFLLPQVESAREIPADSPPSWLPETEAHQALRERIAGLLHRAAIDPDTVKVAARDVFLFPTGMAAIYRVHQCLQERKPGLVMGLGSIFHNTYHLFHEAPCGFQHFGQANGSSNVMEQIEEWVEKEKKAVSYCFVEFPSNPLLVSVDLKRLRQIADKYDFTLVVDDTVGSFANIDVSSVADVLVSSTTKSFSGYADAMGGSAVLFGSSPRYEALSAVFHSRFRNEVFSADAAHLLSNSSDYLARTAVLNRNAVAVAAALAARRQKADGSSVTGVLYPPYTDSYHFLTPFLRKSTPELPAPGSGCLLSVDLASLGAAEAFYDALQFHKGPHLGAHRALAIPFNNLVYWKDPDEGRYHAAYGLRREQVRISVGLEDEDELVACVEEALDAAEKVWAEEKKGGN